MSPKDPVIKDKDEFKQKITGMWINKGSWGGGFWTSAKLTQPEIDDFIQFAAKGPCKIMIYRKERKRHEKQPDGILWLYRYDDDWKEKKATKKKDYIEIPKKEEEPF